jgi:hypothetical protein
MVHDFEHHGLDLGLVRDQQAATKMELQVAHFGFDQVIQLVIIQVGFEALKVIEQFVELNKKPRCANSRKQVRVRDDGPASDFQKLDAAIHLFPKGGLAPSRGSIESLNRKIATVMRMAVKAT